MNLAKAASLILSLVVSGLPVSGNCKTVLMVVGAAKITKGEALIKSRLEQDGFSTTVIRDRKAKAKSADSVDLVLISDSVQAKNLKKVFRTVPAALISLSPEESKNLGMTSRAGGVSKQSGLYIVDPAKALAGGLSGAVQTNSKKAPINWGSPLASALSIATLKAGSKKSAIFAYEPGARMAGLTAPGKRVGLFLSQSAAVSLTGDGWQLFEAAVAWAVQPAIPSSPAGSRTLVFYNNGTQTIWVGGSGLVPTCPVCPDMIPLTGEVTGFELPSKSYKILTVPDNLQSANFWPRTGCSVQNNPSWEGPRFVCESGDCGNAGNKFGLQCNGGSKAPPTNSFEITFNPSTGYLGNVTDYYDLTNVDGYSLGIQAAPLPGRFAPVSPWDVLKDPKFNCGTATDANFDMNKCPPELRGVTAGGLPLCWSLCKAVSDPNQSAQSTVLTQIAANPDTAALVCCACDCGANCGCDNPSCKYGCSPYANPPSNWGICDLQRWPVPDPAWCSQQGVTDCTYPGIFKTQSADAYSWQFNDGASTYQCRDADYMITFQS